MDDRNGTETWADEWRAGGCDAGLGLERGLPAREVDARLRADSRVEAEAVARLCFYFLEVRERRLYRELGYSTLLHYVEAALGWAERKAQGMLAMGATLARYPLVRAAFVAGRLGWTKVRELARVLTPENEEHWVSEALRRTSRELERCIYRMVPRSTPKHRMGNLMEGPNQETVREVCFRVRATERVPTWELARHPRRRVRLRSPLPAAGSPSRPGRR
jgi:hypothetical protein